LSPRTPKIRGSEASTWQPATSYAFYHIFNFIQNKKFVCHTAISGPTQNMTSFRRRPGSTWACRARSSPFLWKGVAPSRAPQKSVTFLWVIAGDGVWVNWRIRANTTTLPLPVALPFASEGELWSATCLTRYRPAAV